jgi:hypothetical protein
VELTAHFQLAPILRMSRATLLLPRDTVMARTVTVLLMMMLMIMITICTINCNYRIIVTLCILETWLVAGIQS